MVEWRAVDLPSLTFENRPHSFFFLPLNSSLSRSSLNFGSQAAQKLAIEQNLVIF